ncbi:uncharacterized protein HaLaN_13423 [Haematococcus lacustris]|uniref:Uncharacterized protein n=1 Tax=Haematococcus lacustris TaxID=44745 RepID=A0A699Z2V5_HAELA|nr:uncharacterized protein HaLaN_13423 [Haematococcus lacustris]
MQCMHSVPCQIYSLDVESLAGVHVTLQRRCEISVMDHKSNLSRGASNSVADGKSGCGEVAESPPQATTISSLQVQAAKAALTAQQIHTTMITLLGCSSIWITFSIIDAQYTPCDPTFKLSKWCMVGYTSNLILTLLKRGGRRGPARVTVKAEGEQGGQEAQ